jgi:hypothetical protein
MTLVQAATKSWTNFSLGVGARVDFREGAELRVGTEDEVDRGRGPLDLAGLAVAAFEEVLADLRLLPDHGLVEEVDEEVIGERAGLLGHHAEAGEADGGVEGAHAADEDRHLRRRERQELGAVDEVLRSRTVELAGRGSSGSRHAWARARRRRRRRSSPGSRRCGRGGRAP